MAAQNPQIFGTAAGVFFAPRPNFEHGSQQPIGDEFLHDRDDRAVAGLVGDGQAGMSRLAGADQCVGLSEGAAEGLFHIDVNAAFRTMQHHRVVLVDPAGADGDNGRLLALNHLAEIGIGGGGPKTFLGRLTSGGVGIGDRHDFCFGNFLPDRIETMAIVSPSCAANHPDADLVCHGGLPDEGLGEPPVSGAGRLAWELVN